MVEFSTRSLSTHQEIESLLIQLWNLNATIRGYQRMVEGQGNDLYACDTEKPSGPFLCLIVMSH
jgi:hypothetical protein